MSSIEESCARLGAFLHARCIDLQPSETHHNTFLLSELAKQTGISMEQLAILRSRHRHALRQAIAPGRNAEFVVVPQSRGRQTAIAVRRCLSDPPSAEARASNYYVVQIHARGYAIESVHRVFEEAAVNAIPGRTSCSVVVRDGKTGKRYCAAELREMLAART